MTGPALTADERQALEDPTRPGLAMAMRIVVEAARLLQAPALVPIVSAHIDGCLYHGDSGVHFAERLVELGARVAVRATLNVGALDLLHPERVRGDAHHREMSRRLMQAHLDMDCEASWTCAPYQSGHRPALGAQVAWGESNAVAFCNSVLGARTNRYGDFLDIACAITGKAPSCGLHVTENRRATLEIALSPSIRPDDLLWPVLGAWLGREAGSEIAVITGAPPTVSEDDLKALGAGAASTGAVGLFHMAGITPEAPTVDAACQNMPPRQRVEVTLAMLTSERRRLARIDGDRLDCVALGSPHFSLNECRQLLGLLDDRPLERPIYLCTSRAVLAILEQTGARGQLEACGVLLVTDSCVVVTPILPVIDGGVMLTNSAKFAHYGKGNTGYATVLASLAECVASARAGRIVMDQYRWS